MSVEVRRIRPEDWREFKELRLEALKDSPLAFVEQYDESVHQPDDFWQARVERGSTEPGVATFVAVHDGQLVGKSTARINPEITDRVAVDIVGVYVTPSHRGRGQTAAEGVVMACVNWAKALPADRLALFVTDVNTRAEVFYTRLGFVRNGVTMVYPPDPAYTDFEMEYPLP